MVKVEVRVRFRSEICKTHMHDFKIVWCILQTVQIDELHTTVTLHFTTDLILGTQLNQLQKSQTIPCYLSTWCIIIHNINS